MKGLDYLRMSFGNVAALKAERNDAGSKKNLYN